MVGGGCVIGVVYYDCDMMWLGSIIWVVVLGWCVWVLWAVGYVGCVVILCILCVLGLKRVFVCV